MFAVCCVIFLFTFGMYGITLKAAAYPTFVCFVIILTALTVDACMKYGKWKRMQEILQKAGLVFLKAIDVDTQGEVTEQTERICIIAREHGKRKEA